MFVEYPGMQLAHKSEDPHMFIADHGSYMLLGAAQNRSLFCGVHLLDLATYEMQKCLHDIRISSETAQKIVVRPKKTFRIGEKSTEQFFFHDRIACYAANTTEEVTVLFDARHAYNHDIQGREHEVRIQQQNPTIVFVNARGSEFFVLTNAPVQVQNKWIPTQTTYDSRRGGRNEWWVYDGLRMQKNQQIRIVVCARAQLQEAKSILADEKIWDEDGGEWKSIKHILLTGLKGLLTRTPNGEAGIIAGLPWFFQIYARDEAIATGGLLCENELQLAGAILLRQIAHILEDGRVQNRFPRSETGSADGVGWAFTRLDELYTRGKEALTQEQWKFVYHQLQLSLSRLAHDSDGILVINKPQETWMDTTAATKDDRHGARIEIQALTLRMLSLAKRLSKVYDSEQENTYRKKEENLREEVKKIFFDKKNNLLADGVTEEGVDWTKRPNIFLALYVYPELLEKKEWMGVVENTLQSLHTTWSAGLTTIDVHHYLFQPVHTGKQDTSYHRGDSWYFMNNIAAIALLRLDKEVYKKFAEDIFHAGVRDTLWMGAAGNCSEISSANQQEAFGCWSQAWSASTLLELDAERNK